jgi:hypothetical protein
MASGVLNPLLYYADRIVGVGSFEPIITDRHKLTNDSVWESR